ncbi:MAG: ABC transporter ATP-binding protein/permease [Streptococcaceae bacterium]|nr:ABC transporter ATP-binding protein/permease [Streptococcaceae bacterium]
MIIYMKKFKKENLLAFLAITMDAFLTVLSSVLLAKLLNSLVAMNLRKVMFWLGVLVFVWLLDSLTCIARDFLKERVLQLELNAIRAAILQPLTQMSYVEFNKNSTEDYNSWLNNDMTLLYDNGFQQIYFAYEAIVMMIFSGIAVILFHWILLVTMILAAFILFYLPKIFEALISKSTMQVSERANQALATSTDYLKGFSILYQNNRLDYFKQKIMTAFEQLKNVKIKLTLVQAYMIYSLGFVGLIFQGVILLVAAILIIHHQITVGVIFSVGNLAGIITNYSKSAANNIITLKATARLMDKYPKINSVSTDRKIKFTDRLSVQHLSVKFAQQEISYPDFTIKKGKKYALIGESGSGKSTLIQLLLGNIQDYQGEISLDGESFRQINPKLLPSIISNISQFPYLFHESVEENLTLGRKISPTQFLSVLTSTCATELVSDKRNIRFDNNLSGGQQARISIARELLANKPILLMDESTANLDKTTALIVERNILQNPDLTVIMITHHLYDETRQYFDAIITL